MTIQPNRLDAIDSARGIGIILVVFGHAWRGAYGAGLLPDTALFAAVDAGIYAFHMPLFFFLSGLLMLDMLAKHRMGDLLRGRVTRLLWPMALWTWLFFGFKLLGGAAVNSPVSLGEMPIIPLPPYEHLWFLWALFLCQSLAVLLYALLPKTQARNLTMIGAAAVSLLMAVLSPYVFVPSLIWGPTVAHLPFFLLGIVVGGGKMTRPNGFVSVLAAGVFFGQIYLVTTATPPGTTTLTSLLLLVFAWMAWMGVDRGGDAPVLKALRYLGKVSMVIYLTHTIFSAALRIGLVRLGIEDVTTILIASTAIGLVAPLAVLWGARKTRAVKLLGF